MVDEKLRRGDKIGRQQSKTQVTDLLGASWDGIVRLSSRRSLAIPCEQRCEALSQVPCTSSMTQQRDLTIP